MLSASTEFSLDEFSIVPWFASSPAANYSEFNLDVVGGTWVTEALVLYAGYNYIRARDNNNRVSDSEISLDLVYKWLVHGICNQVR